MSQVYYFGFPGIHSSSNKAIMLTYTEGVYSGFDFYEFLRYCIRFRTIERKWGARRYLCAVDSVNGWLQGQWQCARYEAALKSWLSSQGGIYKYHMSVDTYTGVTIDTHTPPKATVSMKLREDTPFFGQVGIGGIAIGLTLTVREVLVGQLAKPKIIESEELLKIALDYDGDPIQEGPQREVIPVGNDSGDFIMLPITEDGGSHD